MPSRPTPGRRPARPAALAAAAGLLLAVAGQAQASQCGVDTICGVKNAEDMVRLGDSRWALAGRLARGPGGFYLVDLKARTAAPLMPDLSGPAAPAYSGCPGAPATGSLFTHGLDVRLRRDGSGEVFALSHGDRESVEVFDLRPGPAGPALAWKGCVIVPPEANANANALAVLPDGFALTSFGSHEKQSTADLIAGRPSGFVMTWSRAAGWKRLAGSDFPGDNGVAATADGRTLYVAGWGDGTLHVLDLGPRPKPPVTVQLEGMHPDNVHFIAGGRLLVAGQVGERAALLNCGDGPVCAQGSAVLILDPRTLKVRARVVAPATADFGAASVAVAYEDGYWASSFQGDRIVRLK